MQSYKTKYSRDGVPITVIEFETFEELQDYFLREFDNFRENGIKTKVIGTSLLIFKGDQK